MQPCCRAVLLLGKGLERIQPPLDLQRAAGWVPVLQRESQKGKIECNEGKKKELCNPLQTKGAKGISSSELPAGSKVLALLQQACKAAGSKHCPVSFLERCWLRAMKMQRFSPVQKK